MSDMADKILDAAEDRIRAFGFHGFSFRDLASDVGIKSASVHYHFPSKADLGVRVARRYTERFLASLPDPAGTPHNECFDRYRLAFRSAIVDGGRMCMCGMLGAEIDGLPEEVRAEVRTFVDRNIDYLERCLGDRDRAWQMFALLEGAMIAARGSGRPEAFDLATQHLATALTAAAGA